jgi:predicted component of type VI protein secretion system
VSRKLVITDGTRERELQLVGRLVVGRDPSCDISHDHSLLSRRHAEFVTTGSAVTVRDLGSRNGLFINGTRAADRTLEPGDVVQIGPLRARYVVDDAAPSIIPEALDDDRTAMLRKPDVAPASAAPAPTLVTPAAASSVLEDTVVPQGPADEDVTRMVPAPVPSRPASRADAPVSDEEITRFTPGPSAPDFAAAVLRPVATDVSSAAAAPARPAAVPTVDSGLAQFVLIRVLLVALVAVSGTVAAGALVPGAPGLLLALVVAGGAAVMAAGIITGRVARAADRS